jgi:hypothetical protein
MYCSTCGVAVAQGLSYCNYCGAKLNTEEGKSVSKSPEVNPQFLLSAMIGLFILGLAAITVLMGMMKTVLGLPVERVLGFALLPFLVMLLLEGLCLRLLMRRNRPTEKKGDRAPLNERATKELDAASEQFLAEAVPSVTDHTTRTLEPVYREPHSK